METQLVIENLDILPGTSNLGSSILVYLLNLKTKYLIMKNMKIQENLKFIVYTIAECSAIFEKLDVNMDYV